MDDRKRHLPGDRLQLEEIVEGYIADGFDPEDADRLAQKLFDEMIRWDDNQYGRQYRNHLKTLKRLRATTRSFYRRAWGLPEKRLTKKDYV